ncbi:MAG: phosphotransferase family protein [Deltaproteobacteria bacterium]|nr:phosphotransferase family protein [Deltaproteobacteria bacterium]MCW5800957.1 phosphotransferase family protein [Deltaproteobacteria bacterium]
MNEPAPVRPGEELALAPLAAYLDRELGGTSPVTVEQFPGGHSNLTYLVHRGDREMVLRRPPFGSKVKSAHDMGREVAVLSKLAPVYARAPQVYAYEATGEVLGAPFYLMERRRGVILRKDLSAGPAGLADDHPRVRRICELLVEALVDLHAVDYRAAGLGDFGKPAGYVERQVTGWTERYAGSQTDDIPAVTEVTAWLAAHRPADHAPSLIHNDFKFDNVIFTPELDAIVGVLDWEMATVGDPLMDLGASLGYWAQADDPPAYHQLPFGPTARPGMLTRSEVARRYAELSGRDVDDVVFYYAFGLFRTAVIAQQIYYRFAKGLTKDPRFATMIFAVRLLVEQARTAIHRNAI